MITFAVIASACIGSYFLGWCFALGFYAFRRFAWTAIR